MKITFKMKLREALSIEHEELSAVLHVAVRAQRKAVSRKPPVFKETTWLACDELDTRNAHNILVITLVTMMAIGMSQSSSLAGSVVSCLLSYLIIRFVRR
jgi:hypothetical protein